MVLVFWVSDSRYRFTRTPVSEIRAGQELYHRKRDSIDAHLTVVMDAMAVGHLLEQRSGLSLKRLVRTLKKYRTFELHVGNQTVHAASPLPDEVAEIISQLPSASPY